MNSKVIRKPNLQFYARLAEIKSTAVKVGHFSDAGKVKDSEMTIPHLMAVHEYGYDELGIPARPVYQQAILKNKDLSFKIMAHFYIRALKGKTFTSVSNANKNIGLYFEKIIKESFTQGTFQALSPNYKKRPSGTLVTESSTPLVDTGENLKNTVSSKLCRWGVTS